RAYHEADTVHLCGFSNGIVTTGDTNLNNPTATPPVYPAVTDTVLKAKATALLNIVSGRQTKPATTTADQETAARNELLTLLDGLANQVETISNQIAVAAGDVSKGIAELTHVGFLPQGKGHKSANTFRQRPSAKGNALIQFPHAGRGAIYVSRCAKTTAEGVLPASWNPSVPISKTELLITGGGLKTGDILAVQYGLILTSHASVLPAEEVSKAVSPLSTKSGKKKRVTPVYVYGTDPIVWSSTILYAVVQ
ncbi:MAG: hypothetical protein ABR968_00475, partial [Bacteroidales bacterium]